MVEIATVGAVQEQAVLPELLTGPRDVVLRRWIPTDAELLGSAVAQSLEHIRPWLPWASHEPLPVERRKQMILDWEREWLRGGDVLMGIFVAGQTAGGCGLHRRLDPDGLEIGYWTHSAFVRRGIATTAADLLTNAAFHVRGITHVEIHVDKSNDVSLAIPRKLGYRLITEESVEPAAPGEIGLHCIWRLTREEWTTRDRLTHAAGERRLACGEPTSSHVPDH